MRKHPPETAYANCDDPHVFDQADPCLRIIDTSQENKTQRSQSDFEPNALT